MDGLIGSRGILPVAGFMTAARAQSGAAAWKAIPTLCLLNDSDAFLHGLCGAGLTAAVLAVAGVLPAATLGASWLCYLSLQVAGQEFLGFQWDILLLETGFLAVWYAPLTLVHRARRAGKPSRLARWLLLWLLFRLMFASGYVKLASGDPLWRSLTALTVHYQTQPLPPWTAWYAHQLPAWFQRLSCAVLFAIELGAPFLLVLPDPWRAAAAIPLAGLQLLILGTGNYCFFNLLALALCLPLLADRVWPDVVRRRFTPHPEPVRGAGPCSREWAGWVIVPVFAVLGLASATHFAAQLGVRVSPPAPLAALERALADFRVVSGYGLFAVMTPTRPEIVVEGSRDGKAWKAYAFRWKPGEVTSRPEFVAPHQPRLDWQMWFAALGSARENRWFQMFCLRLLEGSPPVLALLAANPFPDGPPRYLRATLYDYRFTVPMEKERTGAWWVRRSLRAYLPVVSLR